MPYFGAHESVAGGLYHAFSRIAEVGGESLQIFTRNQRQWRPKPLDDEEVRQFRSTHDEHFPGMIVASHASYLLNLASGKEELAAKSTAALAEELQRCSQLRIPYVVMHPGSHGGDGVEAGIQRFTENLDKSFERGPDDVMLLLETTAGQGTGLGATFEELAAIIHGSRFPERLGVCLDTCHVFAAGYDLRTSQGYEKTMSALEETVGLAAVKFMHLNDAKKDLGSRVDRHEHIGKGQIGLEGFALLVNDSRFQDLPMTLETPKSDDLHEDRENLATLRSLLTASWATS